MKRWKWILAGLLATMLLFAVSVVAEPEFNLEGDGSTYALTGEGIDGVISEDAPELLPDGIETEMIDHISFDETLDTGVEADVQTEINNTAKLDRTSLTISTIDTTTLKLTGLESGDVKWTSSNKNVVKITESDSTYAIIEGISAGRAVITAKITKGKTLKCKVYVIEPVTFNYKLGAKTGVYRYIDVTFKNHSAKKIFYINFDMKQYKGKKKLKSASDKDYNCPETIRAGKSITKRYLVNGNTMRVEFILLSVKVDDPPVKISTVKIVDESGKRMLYSKFANRSDKKITHILLDVLQYNSRNQKLKSPYSDFDLDTTIKAHASVTKKVDVNAQTDHVKYKILQVRFSDGTTWRP